MADNITTTAGATTAQLSLTSLESFTTSSAITAGMVA